MNPWIQIRSGKIVDLLEPDYSALTIADIAYSLAHINRFTGHVGTYSVAQHCVLVSYHCGSHAKRGVTHDWHEAVIGDFSSPVKQVLRALGGGAAVKELDYRHMRAVDKRWFNGYFERPDEVHVADMKVLVTERRDFLGDFQAQPWEVDAEPFEQRIERWSPEYAAKMLQDRALELGLT